MDLSPLLTPRGRAWAWLALTAGLALHVADEAANDFLAVYNPNAARIREALPFLPIPTFAFASWIAALATAVAILLALTACVVRAQRWTIVTGYVYGAIMLINGVAHASASLFLGRLMPGVLSSPVIVPAAIVLLVAVALRQDRAPRRLTSVVAGRALRGA
jgi:hypothetical protein